MTVRRLAARALAGLQRRLLGISAEEIRCTFEDVRSELRASRAELKDEIAGLRTALERVEGRAADGDRPERRPAAEA